MASFRQRESFEVLKTHMSTNVSTMNINYLFINDVQLSQWRTDISVAFLCLRMFCLRQISNRIFSKSESEEIRCRFSKDRTLRRLFTDNWEGIHFVELFIRSGRLIVLRAVSADIQTWYTGCFADRSWLAFHSELILRRTSVSTQQRPIFILLTRNPFFFY